MSLLGNLTSCNHSKNQICFTHRKRKGLKKMLQTLICPSCGCSLVRLGITKDKAVSYHHNGEEHRFCCQGCVEVFVTDPEEYLREVSTRAVCPVCLAEKPRESTVENRQSN